ncbi:MAG: hypothetical protein WD669_01400 [Pirellulales bacterium]
MGTASGWVVAQEHSSEADINPGQTATSVNVGPGTWNVDNNQFAPGGTATAMTRQFSNKVAVTSFAPPSPDDDLLSYAGSYWGDQIVFLGGVGPLEVDIAWDINSAIRGSGGPRALSAPIVGTEDVGVATVRWRWFYGQLADFEPINLSNPTLFLDLALAETGFLEHPAPAPLPPGELPHDNFLFAQLDELGEPTGELLATPWSSPHLYLEGVGQNLEGVIVGARVGWEFGTPMPLGFLLEGWASGGGIVDYSNSGTFVSITVPRGTTVMSEADATYNIIEQVPEPTAVAMLVLGGLLMPLWRRR